MFLWFLGYNEADDATLGGVLWMVESSGFCGIEALFMALE